MSVEREEDGIPTAAVVHVTCTGCGEPCQGSYALEGDPDPGSIDVFDVDCPTCSAHEGARVTIPCAIVSGQQLANLLEDEADDDDDDDVLEAAEMPHIKGAHGD